MNIATSSITRDVSVSVTYDHGRLCVDEGENGIDIQVDTSSNTIKLILTGTANTQRTIDFDTLYGMLST